MISLIQHFEADYLWKVSLKILNSGIILRAFTHETLKKYLFCPLLLPLSWHKLQPFLICLPSSPDRGLQLVLGNPCR